MAILFGTMPQPISSARHLNPMEARSLAPSGSSIRPVWCRRHARAIISLWMVSPPATTSRHDGSRTMRDSHKAYDRALALGAQPVDVPTGPMELKVPAIKGLGGAPLYLIDRWQPDRDPQGRVRLLHGLWVRGAVRLTAVTAPAGRIRAGTRSD